MKKVEMALVLMGALMARPAAAGVLELNQAVVLAPGTLSGPEKKAVTMLVEEVEKRSGVRWATVAAMPSGSGPVIAVGQAAALRPLVGARLDGLVAAPAGKEGYRLQATGTVVLVVGNDERGTLFGVGRLLRSLRMERQKVTLDDGIRIASSPRYPVRGHQIGYRPKVNTYDAWTPAVFEQYVRDMAVFGVNSVELIPPNSDDDEDSPHFPLPKLAMMAEMSRILAEYGLDVWIWYPLLHGNPDDAQWLAASQRDWEEVFSKLPRVDAVFVPGGDPGDLRPKRLFAHAEKQAEVLRRHHPRAQMWVSPQNFDAAWLDEFAGLVKAEPAWLNGIVYGPWVRVPYPELRARIPKRYPIRIYPDITHSIHCEYPVPGWDLAFTVTEARETINPRPVDQTKIFRLTSPDSAGFISYSEGVNDDVNKFVWSGLGWDPETAPIVTLREFARYFIGPGMEDDFAQGLMALERNWRGPLMANEGVETTLQQFQRMERAATPAALRNWRFQQTLYRAYYDGYVRDRLIYETGLERQAATQLRGASQTGSLAALDLATATLDRAVTQRPAADLRARVSELAEALYQSIGMQLSVDRYRAAAVSRGANLDNLDFPLNNRIWLELQFAEIRRLPGEKERLAAIDAILNRTNPGPGGFYDDLGNVSRQPHLVDPGPGYDKDPGSFRSVRSASLTFGGDLIGRTSQEAISPDGPARFLKLPKEWWDFAQTRYETPLVMRYRDLDPAAAYKVRVVYVSDEESSPVKLVANGATEVHGFMKVPTTMKALEFDVPASATRSGELELSWHSAPGGGGFSSEVDIAEVFLIRK